MTHWSSRRLADWLRRHKKLQLSHDSITRLWRRFCLQPQRAVGFKFSTDPQLEVNVGDVVGLYLNPLPSSLSPGNDGLGLGSLAVPAWLIAPCSWYGLGGVAPGAAGA